MTYRSLLIAGTLLLAACVPASPTQTGNGGMMQDGQGMMGGNRGGMMQGSFLPASDKDVNQLPAAKPMSIMEVQDGDTIALNPELVRATVNGKGFAMYAYNGQFPGPTLKVKQGSTFTVNVTNNIDVPTTIHWHGIRLENKFDGAAGVTQDAIEPGKSFTYTVTVPDDGMFWYHPHVREDLQQDMGLYGGLWVTPKNETSYNSVDREEVLMLDDLLLEGGSPVPYGAAEADHALMGRFGNSLLVNGMNPLSFGFGVQQGIVRLYLINAANTRTFRFQVRNARSESLVPLTLVGGDAGRYEHEQRVSFVTLGPSERAVVDVRFDEATTYTLEHGGPGDFQYALGTVVVDNALPSVRQRQDKLREHADVIRDINASRSFFDKPADKTIHLSVASMPARMMGGNTGSRMQHGGGHGDSAETPESDGGIEWEDPMPQVNAMSVKHNTKWKLIDEASAAENMDIAYRFKVGDKVKIRLVNDKEADGSDHPMQHPIHFHGQRFLVLAVNGERNDNLVWKDTVLVPKDATVDILLEVTNPGDWMMHCHIAEHLSNGMMGVFRVE